MNHRAIYVFLLLIVATSYCLAIDGNRSGYARAVLVQQTGSVQESASLDPLKQLAGSFPDSIHVKNHGRLLEFCPDGTCDGFVVSGTMSITTLGDFAYLYEYYFSDYTFLGEWRGKEEARNTAERVLSKPEYSNCKSDSEREAARCVLLDLSRGGHVRLIFVRYDEGARSVVPRDLAQQLREKKSAPN
jgi:hypothetical protein